MCRLSRRHDRAFYCSTFTCQHARGRSYEPRLSSRTARAASRSGTHPSEYTERWVPALASLGRDDNSQASPLRRLALRQSRAKDCGGGCRTPHTSAEKHVDAGRVAGWNMWKANSPTLAPDSRHIVAFPLSTTTFRAADGLKSTSVA